MTGNLYGIPAITINVHLIETVRSGCIIFGISEIPLTAQIEHHGGSVSAVSVRLFSGAEIDAAALIDSGLVKKVYDGIKILGNGELTKSFTVKASKFTASAAEKIEKAGGKAEVV